MFCDGVVVPPPMFDDDLCFPEGVEDFPIQKFVPEACIEGLAIAVFPRCALVLYYRRGMVDSIFHTVVFVC